MKSKKKYRKLENELDKIILAEINTRIDGEPKKESLMAVNNRLEQKNREIVTAHQMEKVDVELPAIFSGYLQTKAGGKLYMDEKELSGTEFENYMEKRGRFEVLFSAALNALQDTELKHIINEKNKQFDLLYQKTISVLALIQHSENIKKRADDTEAVVPRDEEEAVAYLREIAPLQAELREIEAEYIALRQENSIVEALQKLRSVIHLASKSLASKSEKASKFVFNQASSVFQNYKATGTEISNANIFMAQKAELTRYNRLFESIGDQDREKQTGYFISVIETTLAKLQKEIEKQKEAEAVISEKNSQKANKGYQAFLEIKERYAQGELDTKRKEKKAVLKLKKCCDILKAEGQRVKAKEIERFLNSTEIAKPEEKLTENAIEAKYRFYKKAFLTLLSITTGIALIAVYYFIYHAN